MEATTRVNARISEEVRTALTKLRQTARRPPATLLPLYHLGQRIVVDLQAQFVTSDEQVPTVYPPQICGLEFTEKFDPLAFWAISPPIGVNRLISAAAVVKTTVTALVGHMFKYRQSAMVPHVAGLARPKCDQLLWAT